MTHRRSTSAAALAALALTGCAALPAGAQDSVGAAAPAPGLAPGGPTYADLADLAGTADLVLRAEVRKVARLKPERAPDLPPGMARLYVEARTGALLSGSVPVGEQLRYLVDLPTDAKGDAPKLKKRTVLLFARPVPGRPGELQLVAPDAQYGWSPALEERLRTVLSQYASADAPPRVTGVRDALSVAGNLAGESETQIFLETAGRRPASISVVRRPGMAPGWGVSFGEIVDAAATAPARDTLAWYRLACFLPPALPDGANLSNDTAARAQARADYAFVLDQLGPCPRTRQALP